MSTIGEILQQKGAAREHTVLRVATRVAEGREADARTILEKWLRTKATALHLAPPVAAQSVARAGKGKAGSYDRVSTPRAYVFRLEHPDADVPDRRWRTGASLRDGQFATDLSVRSVDLTGIYRTVPTFVRDLVSAGILLDADTVLEPLAARITPAAARSVCELIENPNRRLPVLIATEPLMLAAEELERIGSGIAHLKIVTPPATFTFTDTLGERFRTFDGAVRLFAPGFKQDDSGLWHPRWLQQAFASDVRRTLTQIREVLFANVSARDDEPFDFDALASRALGERVVYVMPEVLSKPRPLLAIVDPIAEETTTAVPSTETRVPATSPEVAGARATEGSSNEEHDELAGRYAEAIARHDAALESIADLRAEYADLESDHSALRDELARARTDVNEYIQLYSLVETERDELKRQVDELTAGGATAAPASAEALDIASLRSRLSQVEARMADAASQGILDDLAARVTKLEYGGGPSPKTADPDLPALPEYGQGDALQSYLDVRYPDRFVVLPRAIAAWDEGEYEDRDHLVAALELLGDQYHAMRTAVNDGGAAYRAFEDRRKALMLRFSGAISDAQYGNFRSTYTIEYRGTPIRIENHLRSNGNSLNPKRGLAIYLSYDEERNLIVLCSLPGHLDNRMTPS